jgi:hypothetical protein
MDQLRCPFVTYFGCIYGSSLGALQETQKKVSPKPKKVSAFKKKVTMIKFQ